MSTTPAFRPSPPQWPQTLVAPVPRVTLMPREAAQALGVSEGTLAGWFRARIGPPSFVVPGGRLRLYPVDGLREWAAAHARDDEQQQDAPSVGAVA
jgi:hypothetical protein